MKTKPSKRLRKARRSEQQEERGKSQEGSIHFQPRPEEVPLPRAQTRGEITFQPRG